MAEAGNPAFERIERALDRIEKAAARRTEANASLEQRHALLRGRVAEAISALDILIEQERG